MSFRPNIRGPFCPSGEITVAAAGTAIPLDQNWSPKYNPNTPVDATNPEQYSISFEDIIISSPPGNAGGLYLVSYNSNLSSGGKGSVDTILLYIPKGSGPVSVKKFLGNGRFNPSMLAIDADQDGDKCWPVGVVG